VNAAQLTRLPIQDCNALTAANRAKLTPLWLTDRAQALLKSIYSWTGSMWLDAVPYAPSLRLDDESFQDTGRDRMGVRTFSSFGTCWTCSCGHTIEDDDVVHALGCNRLSGLVQSRHDETAEVLGEFVVRLGFSSSREMRYFGSLPAPQTAPRRVETSIATCAQAPAMCSPMSCSFILSLIHTFVLQLEPAATLQLLGTLTSAGTTT
jgi:hypothetical protein